MTSTYKQHLMGVPKIKKLHAGQVHNRWSQECKCVRHVIALSKCLCLNSHMATLDNDDLKAIKNLIEVTIDEAIEAKGLVTKEDISHLPSKDEFYTKMDEVMGELKTIREEQPLLSHRVSDHEDRIGKIESQLGMSSN